jgi:two-component system response regulator HupR/HoxA
VPRASVRDIVQLRVTGPVGSRAIRQRIGEKSPTPGREGPGYLESREVRPLGGTRARPVDVLIIAASNSDLRDAVREWRFEDLDMRFWPEPARAAPGDSAPHSA